MSLGQLFFSLTYLKCTVVANISYNNIIQIVHGEQRVQRLQEKLRETRQASVGATPEGMIATNSAFAVIEIYKINCTVYLFDVFCTSNDIVCSMELFYVRIYGSVSV